VRGTSVSGEGVHGESKSTGWAGVAGIQTSTGPGVWGISQGGEGVHGESHSARWAGVAAINRGTGPGLWAQGNIAGHFQGDIEVSGDIRLLNGQDCAEEFDISSPEEVEPGTVMVIDEGGALRISRRAYDKRVAGVVSGAKNLKPGIILGKQCSARSRMPVALLGKAYCKVDAQYGSIEVGDLLASSPTPGHAMKAQDASKAFGSVLGKALCALGEGQGLIPILISLQ
jgi:hypothetical protein